MNQPSEEAGMASRHAALSILYQILQQKRALDEAFERDEIFPQLSAQDRGFVRMLVATALRRKGQMDDLIRRASDKDADPNPIILKFILYIGLTQILFMEVPDFAAVDTSVQLCDDHNLSRQKGFINAILRRMTGEGREWARSQDLVRMNIPGWLLSSWIEDYGLNNAAQLAQASLTEAPLDITLKNPRETALWQGTLEASLLPTGSLRRAGGGMVADLPGLMEGHWWVQDAAAALPVRLLGNIQGKTLYDLCAAPGGKTMQAAAKGAFVTALDRSSSRMNILHQNIIRTGLEGHVITQIIDAAEWKPKEQADIVLLDAPCSATGTIRRHPDLLHLKSARDVQQLMNVQERLLDSAVPMIKAGGTLIYCTCSLQKAEGEKQVDAFLSRHPDFSRQKITASEIGGIADAITLEGDVRLMPYHLAPYGGMDGFFISRLVKS